MINIEYGDDLSSEITELKLIIFKAFIQYCVNELNIKSDITLFLLAKKNEFNITTGGFDRNTNDIMARVEGRALIDVLRTIAHELVHLQQKELGKFDDDTIVQDIGGEIEDEANAVAGQLIKKFSKDTDSKFIYSI